MAAESRASSNKLSSDDSWSGSSLRSLFTHDVLRKIPQCFHRLETQVKIKLLRAFLDLPRRVVEETTVEMREIFKIGSQDEDEGVRLLSEILSPVVLEETQEVKKTSKQSNIKVSRNLAHTEAKGC